MGVRNIMQNSIIFENVRVTEAELLGEVDKGMEVADEALLIARLCMGAISLGGMKRCACRPGCEQLVWLGKIAAACRLRRERELARLYREARRFRQQREAEIQDYPEHVIEAKYQAAYAEIQARRRTPA